MELVKKVSDYVLTEHPTHSAATLAKQPLEKVGRLLDELPAKQTAELLKSMAPTTAAECIRSMHKPGPVLEAMSPDDAGRILRSATRQTADDLLADVTRSQARAIRARMSFEDATIGALVERAILLSPDTTLEEAQAMVKGRNAPYVYAVDHQSRLLGVAKSEELWQEPSNRDVASIMQRGTVSLDHRTPVQTALRHPAWQDYDMLPVVDQRLECVGVLRHKVLRQHALSGTESPPIHTALATALDLAELYWTSSSAMMLGPSLGTGKRHSRMKRSDRD